MDGSKSYSEEYKSCKLGNAVFFFLGLIRGQLVHISLGLIVSRFPEVPTKPTYWVSTLVGRIAEYGIHFVLFGRPPLGREARFGRLTQVGWPSAGFASRAAD